MNTKVINRRTGKIVFEIEYENDNISIMAGQDKAMNYITTHFPKKTKIEIKTNDPKDNFSGITLTVG